MKLKCIDGITRDFYNSEYDECWGYNEVMCKNCKKTFGVHSISVIKDRLIKHICKKLETKK